MDPRSLEAWTSELRRLTGARGRSAIQLTGKGEYKSPMDPELIGAWRRKGNDPETEVEEWIREGVPLGINKKIKTAGIFPPAVKPWAQRSAAEENFVSALKGRVNNYLGHGEPEGSGNRA